MADDRYRREHPQQTNAEEQPTHNQQQDPRGHQYNMSASVTLPSIQDSRGAPYAAGPPPGRGYAHDPRYGSPNAGNGYPPPQGHPAHGNPAYMAHPADGRPPHYPPDQRGYYDDRRPAQYHDQYPPDPYYYRGQGPPPNGYPPRDYHGHPQGGYAAEYAGGGAPGPQAAPRQRTSIACKYCRKRKIRCSGYQSAPGGKCQNCARMNQECVFQPVSSSASTAFIPVSALPGGVPPGTPLYGAYGQPLAPSSAPGGHPYGPGGAPPPHGYYPAPGQSPTEAYPPYGDPRYDERRQREADEHWRRSHPRPGPPDEEPRRKSPGDSTNGSPNYPQQATGPSPRGAPATVARRSPVVQNSSGASTPAKSSTSGQQQPPASVMSLSNLVDKSDIDKGMLGRLNRPLPGAAPQEGSQ